MPEKITKAAFVSSIAEKLDISVKNANEILSVISTEIAELLKQGNSLSLPGLGSFSIKERAARTGRNPSSGETINLNSAVENPQT